MLNLLAISMFPSPLTNNSEISLSRLESFSKGSLLLLFVEAFYIFNSNVTVIERNSGVEDSLYKFIIEKIEDPNNKGTFYSNLLLTDSKDASNIYNYAPDFIFDDSDNKFYLHLEYQGNFKTSTYIKIK